MTTNQGKEHEGFEHVVPLGSYCVLAEELRRIGLRKCAYPFDWIIAPAESVHCLLTRNFDHFLSYQSLFQSNENLRYYYNRELKIWFFHDFYHDIPLRLTYFWVLQKYRRRIQRFLEHIKSPTLFLRIAITKEDAEWSVQNRKRFENVVQKYNPNNKVIWIGHKKLPHNGDWLLFDGAEPPSVDSHLFDSIGLTSYLLGCVQKVGKSSMIKKAGTPKTIERLLYYFFECVRRLRGGKPYRHSRVCNKRGE